MVTSRIRLWAIGVAVLLITSATNAADPVHIETPGQDALNQIPSFGWIFVKMLLTLAAIIAGLLVLYKLLSRQLGNRLLHPKGRAIQVVETIRLEPKKAIYLIKVGDQYLLVGSTESGMQTLAGGPLDAAAIASVLRTDTAAQPQAPADRPKQSFLSLLRRPA